MPVEQKAVRLRLQANAEADSLTEIDELNEYLNNGWMVVELERVATDDAGGVVLVILERSE